LEFNLQVEFKNCSRRREEADFGRAKHFRLVTSAATALAAILEPIVFNLPVAGILR
jgi:hypothetical protein